ncbi:hypothetical protein HDU81_005600 [Chytriomyces hyalinus]|nr:hypothetical protein HDU81_005600 [Chytriomyces hyalinus]
MAGSQMVIVFAASVANSTSASNNSASSDTTDVTHRDYTFSLRMGRNHLMPLPLQSYQTPFADQISVSQVLDLDSLFPSQYSPIAAVKHPNTTIAFAFKVPLNGSFISTAASSTFIYAIGSSPPASPSDPASPIQQHGSNYGGFSLDISRFGVSKTATTGQYTIDLVLLHAVCMIAAWAILPPLAIFIARYLKDKTVHNWLLGHTWILLFGTGGFMIVGLVCIELHVSTPGSQRLRFVSSTHGICGTVLAFGVFPLQCILGAVSRRLGVARKGAWIVSRSVAKLAARSQAHTDAGETRFNDVEAERTAGINGIGTASIAGTTGSLIDLPVSRIPALPPFQSSIRGRSAKWISFMHRISGRCTMIFALVQIQLGLVQINASQGLVILFWCWIALIFGVGYLFVGEYRLGGAVASDESFAFLRQRKNDGDQTTADMDESSSANFGGDTVDEYPGHLQLQEIPAHRKMANSAQPSDISHGDGALNARLDSESLSMSYEDAAETRNAKFEVAGSKNKISVNLDAETALVERVLNTARNATEALEAFERHRPNEFLNIFSDLSDFEGLTTEQIESWDKLIHVTFHILAATELVNSLNQLHSDVYRRTGNKLQIRLHIKHYLPGFIFAVFGPSRLTALKNVFLSSPSIFGLKLATAMFCFLMFLYSKPVIFQQWSMSGAFVSILVAISPSLGQTYLSLPIQIVATTLGSSIAFGGVCAFGRDGAYGLTGFAALLGVPFFGLMLSNIQFLVLGLLTLLSFSNFVVGSFINRTNPRAVSPDVSLYRGVAVTSVALSFALIFTLVLYPTLARNALRHKMFEIFGDFRNYHGKITAAAMSTQESTIINTEDSDIKDTRDNILSQLASLEPLMSFAAVEPRLAGRFQAVKYRAVIDHMRTFLDRLEALRVSGGDAPFDLSVRRILNFGLLGEARMEMQQTVRILMYIFASSMLTKQKLPSLPDASKARDKLFQAFITIIINHLLHMYPAETDPLADMPYDKEGVLAMLNTEKWLRLLSFSASARDVSSELNHFGVLIKDIFGEYPEPKEFSEAGWQTAS